MNHDEWCSRPSPQPDREGILRCPSCKYLADVAPAPRVQVATGYVCRDHHTQPVTFRGKGCPQCPKRKPKQRKAIEPRDQTERQYLT